ncbi:MAG: NAD-dependent epimerase/dehydratase family protein [Planctomycetaceae bacterium]
MANVRPDIIFGCGYLGQRVAEFWRRQGRTVIAVTRSPERAERFRREGLVPHVGDVCRPETLTGLPEADRVLFAVAYDPRSGLSREAVVVDGLQSVLNQFGSRCRARFINISSTSVYGQSDGGWVNEDSPCDPVQPGGQCCLAGERLTRSICSPENVAGNAVILRLAGIYGPGRLLARIEALRTGSSIAGRADAWLNLIHVDDAVQAVDAAASAQRPGMVYLVADDQPVTRQEYYSRLAELVGAPPPRFDEAQAAKRGSGGLNKRCSNARIKAELEIRWQFPTFLDGLGACDLI